MPVIFLAIADNELHRVPCHEKPSSQSLDGNSYRLYLLENPSMAGGGANDNAWWDGTNLALMSSGTETLFGSSTTVVSALKVTSPNDFVAHENGYAVAASDCLVELREDKVLRNQFDNVASNGNVVQCGEVGNVGADTTASRPKSCETSSRNEAMVDVGV